MRAAYPIVISQDDGCFVVFVPDFNVNAQGTDLADAIFMARDAIGLVGIDMEDEKEPLPTPSPINAIKKENPDDIVTLVDVDFTKYRKENHM